MTERHIVAMGGGQWPSDPIYPFLFELADAAKPKVLYVPTATGDNDRGVAMFYRSFPAHSFEPSDLGLFARTVEDLRSFVLAQDVVLVAGGNTLNMLAIWRAHGLDMVLRDAWEAGVIMAGGSAGANCWFEASTTDSYLMGNADPLPDGLGLVAGSFCPHYDSEPSRQPAYRALVADGTLAHRASRATTSRPRTWWARISPRSWSRPTGRAPDASSPTAAAAHPRPRCRSGSWRGHDRRDRRRAVAR